jgi:hypothetical protein
MKANTLGLAVSSLCILLQQYSSPHQFSMQIWKSRKQFAEKCLRTVCCNGKTRQHTYSDEDVSNILQQLSLFERLDICSDIEVFDDDEECDSTACAVRAEQKFVHKHHSPALEATQWLFEQCDEMAAEKNPKMRVNFAEHRLAPEVPKAATSDATAVKLKIIEEMIRRPLTESELDI